MIKKFWNFFGLYMRWGRILPFLVGVLILVFLGRGVIKNFEATRRLSRLRKSVDILREENKILRSDLEALRGTEYVRTEAREKLGMVEGSEEIIILSEKELMSGKRKEKLMSPRPIWKEWLLVFGF